MFLKIMLYLPKTEIYTKYFNIFTWKRYWVRLLTVKNQPIFTAKWFCFSNFYNIFFYTRLVLVFCLLEDFYIIHVHIAVFFSFTFRNDLDTFLESSFWGFSLWFFWYLVDLKIWLKNLFKTFMILLLPAFIAANVAHKIIILWIS